MIKTMARAASAVLVLAGVLGPAPAGAHEAEDGSRQRRHVEQRAHSVVGTPYRYGGTSPAGFDCSGFTTWVFAGHGANLPRSSAAQYQLGDRAGYRRVHDRGALEVGDLVFHKTTSAHVGHVGVYVGGGRFISATSSEGVQVRSLYDPYYWGERWVGGVRLPTTMVDATSGPSPRAAAGDHSSGKGKSRPATRGKKRHGAKSYRPEEWRPHGRAGRP